MESPRCIAYSNLQTCSLQKDASTGFSGSISEFIKARFRFRKHILCWRAASKADKWTAVAFYSTANLSKVKRLLKHFLDEHTRLTKWNHQFHFFARSVQTRCWSRKSVEVTYVQPESWNWKLCAIETTFLICPTGPLWVEQDYLRVF